MHALSGLALAMGLVLSPRLAAEPHGAWDHGAMDEVFYALTTDGGGNVFGQFCVAKARSCLYLVGLPARCEDEAVYPVLVNAESGAFTAVLVCGGRIEGHSLYRYVFHAFAPIDAAVQQSQHIGFAMPVEGDKFRATSFSLDGAVTAVQRMRSEADEARRRVSPDRLDDGVL